jgi:diguanylate cyclase (GGDEF)-like protein/PAS domain S-box-containing protein
LRVLFFHGHIASVKRCVEELETAYSKVISDVVVTFEEFAEHLKAKLYDVVVAEYPNPRWNGRPTLESLLQMERQIPLVFVCNNIPLETMAQLMADGAADCVQVDHIGHLPVAVRRALGENNLRRQRDRAERMLHHSEARYRALVGNLTYGMCHCNAEGGFLDVNQTLVNMLGYSSKAELLEVNHASEVLCDPSQTARLVGQSLTKDLQEPLEIDWKRKDGTNLKVRLSGREVKGREGRLESYEIIVEDVTQQRKLEDHLRQQAAKDPLTGLANYRKLVDVLDAEIRRSVRSGCEFALLLFDLDGLKEINDRYGHLKGSQALCRLADMLCVGCRDIDTAARFGGDEFALVLPETDTVAANLVARRVCEGLRNSGKKPKLSVSVGVAIYPRDGEKLDTLLSAADVALYAMKTKVNGLAMGAKSKPAGLRLKAAAGGE